MSPQNPPALQTPESPARADRFAIESFSKLSDQISGEKNLNAAIAEIAEYADKLIGHQLFTVMAFDSGNRQVRRIFSSQPKAYPPGGVKTKGESAWAKQVLDHGKPFIGMNIDDIRHNFADHELIEELGLASVLNIPVRIADRTIGTMNLLHVENFYRPTHLELGNILANLMCAPLLLHPSFDQDPTNRVAHQ